MVSVSVIGAGPIGLFFARRASEAGLDVTVYEEHDTVGIPAKHTGVLSKNILEHMKLPDSCVLNKVKGARLYSPNGTIAEIKRSETQAYIVNPTILDQELAAGLNVQTGKHATTEKLDTDYIIAADGPNSMTAKNRGFKPIEKFVYGYEYVISNTEYDRDFVEVHFGREVAPDFFAWIVPTDTEVRVGLGSNGKSKQYLDQFVKKHFGEPEILKEKGGRIPLHWRDSFVQGNIALLGDAAGQVKPITGGGLYMGFSSAKILIDAIKQGDLSVYEDRWKREVKPELAMGARVRRMLNAFTDDDWENVINVIASEKMRALIEDVGDMDKPTALIKGLIKNPSLFKLLPKARHLLI